MCIKIETEKLVDGSGDLCRKITGIKALRQNKLPEMYLNSETFVYKMGHGCLRTETKNSIKTYEINHPYSEKEFQKLLKIVHAAGDNLKKCNEILAKKQAEWNGKETFCI